MLSEWNTKNDIDLLNLYRVALNRGREVLVVNSVSDICDIGNLLDPVKTVI